MTVAQLLAFIVQFGSTVVLARYLTTDEMGVAAVAFAVVGMVQLFQQLGLSSLLVREKELTGEVIATTFTANATITLLISLAILLLSYAGAAFVNDMRVQQVLTILAIPPLFTILSFLPGAIMEREGRFKELALITTGGGIIGALLTIFFAINECGYLSIAFAQLGSGFLTATATIAVGRQHARFRLSVQAWKRVSTFGIQMLAITGVNTAASRLSEIGMGRLLGLSALGLFNRANGINGLLWNNVHLAVGRVALVDFADARRRGESLRSRYLHVAALISALLWPAFFGLIVLARPFVFHVYGPRWLPAVTALQLICISSIILSAATMAWELFTASDKLGTQTRIESWKAAFSFLIFVGACFVSLEAAAASRVLEALVTFLVYRPYINQMTDTRTADYWPIYGQGLLLSFAAIAPSLVVTLIAGASVPPMALVSGAICLGLTLWVGLLFAIGHPGADEIRKIVAAVKGGHRIFANRLR